MRDLANGARHELHVNAAFGEDRQERVQLAVADERLAADDREMQRTVAIDELDDAVDELLALEVADLAQRHLAAEVIVAVGVAAGAVQRAFARDFDRQRRRVAGKNSTPRGQTHSILPLYPSRTCILESVTAFSISTASRHRTSRRRRLTSPSGSSPMVSCSDRPISIVPISRR